MSDQEHENDVEAAVVAAKTYVAWPNDFPTDAPTVKITFEGLFCFFFDGKEGCFVGTHNTTQQTGHQHNTHPHDYKITLVTKEGASTTTEIIRVGNPLNDRLPLNFKVEGSAFPGGVTPGVYVYANAEFNRDTGADDVKDWQWIIDFEDRMYPGGVKGMNSTTLRPGIKIDNGLFYTANLTNTKFDLVPEGGGTDIPLNNVAKVQAVNIYLEPGGRVRLRGGPIGTRDFEYAANRTYQVDIRNLCDENSHPICKFDPISPDKKRRNDFFLYYDTFDASQNRPEYLLIRRGNPADDDAPCGAVGFGQTPQA